MKKVALLHLLFLFVLPTFAQDTAPATDNIPYIYYYSGALNGIVVERADGTDSRIIGQGLVDEDVLFLHGPGWSPDGRWFAWRVHTPHGYFGSSGKGYVTSADGQMGLDMLADFPCVNSMLWHPTDNILLVYGTMLKAERCSQLAYPIATYWLFDVDQQTRLATFSIDSAGEWLAPSIYWFPDEQQVQFFESSPTTDYSNTRFFLVTLSYDGEVSMKPISQPESYAGLEGITPDLSAVQDDLLTLFVPWMEATAERRITPPPNSSAVGAPVSGQWDASGNWILVGYEFCVSACAFVTGRVSVFNPETGYSREISDCGGHPACVGWLPERVNIAELPPGRPTSVQPTPEVMDYNRRFQSESVYNFLSTVATHELVCNTDVSPIELTLVRNNVTGEVDFVLPDGNSCGEPVQIEPERIFATKPVVFALSPDGQYFAITDATERTSLYAAETGERIATMDFFGLELSFSEDSRHLITTGRYATATWNVETLVAESLDYLND